MKLKVLCLLIILICLCPVQSSFAKDKTVTADTLTKGDVKKALLSGEITSSCRTGDLPEVNAASLTPATLIIKGINQDGYVATIHFMGRLKKNLHSEARPVVCEANLLRLDSGEWQDPKSGAKLKK